MYRSYFMNCLGHIWLVVDLEIAWKVKVVKCLLVWLIGTFCSEWFFLDLIAWQQKYFPEDVIY